MKRIISLLATISVPLFIAVVQACMTGGLSVYCAGVVVMAAVLFCSLRFLGITGRRYRHIDPFYGLYKASRFNGTVMLLYTLLFAVKNGIAGTIPCSQDIPLLLSIVYLCIQVLVSCVFSCFEIGRMYRYKILLTASAVAVCLSVGVLCTEAIFVSAGLFCYQQAVIRICEPFVFAGAAGAFTGGVMYLMPFLVLHKIDR